VGRAAECGHLVQFLADLRAGSGAALVLLGEPGIGKSALLDYLRQRARDVLVLHVTGVQAEQELAFAGLYQLLDSLAARADALPEPQRAAQRVAFGLEAGEPPGAFVVALATLALLEVLSAERPVLCVVDDQQWR
jgi:predicted ATPase